MKSALRSLIDESVTIIREVAAEFERPAMLFSGGKDSVVMLHLAARAFSPARVPFPMMHIDTGHNFAEVIEFRDRAVRDLDVQLIVGSVQASIDAGRIQDATGPRASRNPLQTVTLLDSIKEHKFDAVFGGARRDEERARAKERVYSHRDAFGQWDPKTQRPELWGIYNGRHKPGEHFRIFPISNWTELDIWQFVADYNIDLPSIYYAHRRQVFRRDNMWMAVSPFLKPEDGESVSEELVRFRTVGDATCTAAIESSATTIEQVIAETSVARITERGATRADDRISEATGEASISAIYPDARNEFAFPELLSERGLAPHAVNETWIMAGPNPKHFVDTTDVLDKKIAALLCHQSQHTDPAGLPARMRGWGEMIAQAGGLPEGRTAEAFLVVDTK